MSDVDSGPDTEGAVDLMELSHKVDGIAEDLKNHKASTDRDTRDLWIFVVAMIVMGSFAVILNTLFPGTSEALTRDDDVDALLAPGVHCFDSHEEMAAARQRALAAIHRINWQIEHPAPASTAPNPYPMFHIQPYDPLPRPRSRAGWPWWTPPSRVSRSGTTARSTPPPALASPRPSAETQPGDA